METENKQENINAENVSQENDVVNENTENQEINTAEEMHEEQAEQDAKTSAEAEQPKQKKSRFKVFDNKLKDELAEANKKIEELQDKYVRQVAEFSNYKKRTAKEKVELRDNAKAAILLDFLPVIDDMDRAMENLSSADVDATIEGVKLIYQKFKDFLRAQELTEIKAMDEEFNTDFHEAVTQFPVEDESKKGKVIDVIQKGYKINDKVVRFSKVVVGQ